MQRRVGPNKVGYYGLLQPFIIVGLLLAFGYLTMGITELEGNIQLAPALRGYLLLQHRLGGKLFRFIIANKYWSSIQRFKKHIAVDNCRAGLLIKRSTLIFKRNGGVYQVSTRSPSFLANCLLITGHPGI